MPVEIYIGGLEYLFLVLDDLIILIDYINEAI